MGLYSSIRESEINIPSECIELENAILTCQNKILILEHTHFKPLDMSNQLK